MNRYRTIPGMGPQKASANTTCQKCLQKGHYSYECKGGLQDRPYASRPSRSQQLSNPKLAPKITNEKPEELLRNTGVADGILAEAKAKRDQERRSRSPVADPAPPRKTRSRSASSVDSVSTISTSRSRSRSRSPFRRRMSRDDSPERRPRRYSSRSMSKARGRKRRRHSDSSSSRSRSRPRQPGSHRKNRRYRTSTPEDRGRPSSPRWGSHRESRSTSVDKSQVTRGRRSIDDTDSLERRASHQPGGRSDQVHSRNDPAPKRPAQPVPHKERSLSPYSKRLALTQAIGR